MSIENSKEYYFLKIHFCHILDMAFVWENKTNIKDVIVASDRNGRYFSNLCWQSAVLDRKMCKWY